MSKEYPLSVQIGEIEREIEMRDRVYAHQVNAGKMKARDAVLKLAIMREVLVTLKALREKELAGVP